MDARRLALNVLDKLEKNHQYSNIAVDHALSEGSLDAKDGKLFAALVYGVTENRITLDHIIDTMATLPPSKIERTTRNILRMGLYQLIFMDRIPPHAAINESVSLCNKRSRGFVNAMLRGFERRRKDRPLHEAFAFPDREERPLEYLSICYSYPIPLCQKLCDIFGFDKTEAMLRAWQKTPPLTARTNTLKLSRDELCRQLTDQGIAPELTEHAPHGIRTYSATPEQLGLEKGLCFVQDQASQICVAALGARPDETVIDMCSCPGSKSFGAAMDMENRGRILSFDLHQSKLSLVKNGAERLGISIIEVAERDGRNYSPELSGIADRVLCDVPCSGLGVVAKKPEIRYKSPEESARLPDIQLAILQNGARYVKPGGTLVYSTCTLAPEENEQNVARFLASAPDFSPCEFSVGALCSSGGMMTLTPDTHGTDGFFIAKLKRKEANG